MTKLKKLIDYYEQNGILLMAQTPSPLIGYNAILPYSNNYTYASISAHAGRSDCIYRNMYRHRFIAVIDID